MTSSSASQWSPANFSPLGRNLEDLPPYPFSQPEEVQVFRRLFSGGAEDISSSSMTRAIARVTNIYGGAENIPLSSMSEFAQKPRPDVLLELVAGFVAVRSVDSDQLQVHRLLHRLREIGADKAASRIEYLVSEENVEDGGDAPSTASINSFVEFYFANPDLREPLLGATADRELQAVWTLPDRHRLVTDFLADDSVRYIYRRAADAGPLKHFITGCQPRHRIRALLDAVSV